MQKRSFSEEPLLDAEFWPLDDDRELNNDRFAI